jgi:hypothetical protein
MARQFARFDPAPFLDGRPVENAISPAALAKAAKVAKVGTGREHFRRFRGFRSPADAEVISDTPSDEPAPPASEPPADLQPEGLLALLEGAARLRRMKPPAGIVPDQIERVQFAGEVLTAGWARQAAALGWSETDLYGCQLGPFPLAVPGGVVVEAVRHDAEVCALTTDTATLRFRDGTGHRYIYRDTLPEGMAPLWDLPSR